MPVITVEGATMNVEQKRKLAEVLTREAAEIMKRRRRRLLCC